MFVEDAAERAERHLHHPVVVPRRRRRSAEKMTSRAAPRDQAPRDLGPEQGAVGRQVVDEHAARVEMVEEVEDAASERGGRLRPTCAPT